MTKPLPPHKSKSIVETFNRHLKDIALYEASSIRPQELKDLLKQPNAWIVVGKSKWT